MSTFHRSLLALAVLLATGCSSTSEPAPLPTVSAPSIAQAEAAREEHADEPEAAAEPEAAEPQTFGAAIDDALPITELAAIVEDPESFRDQVIRTQGEVARVCQRAGCWMELRAEAGPAVRVPMAGHAFFLPRDAAGRHAEMVGRVTIQSLSPDVREHLESEGALATASALSIHATGVALD